MIESRLTCVNYPAIMEERRSKCDLMRERFDRLLDNGWILVEHVFKMRSNNWQHQHVVFSVHALYLEIIQQSEDTIRSRMRSRLGRKMMMDLDLTAPACKLSDDELEGDISATSWRDC